jgi:hypothetical protein
MAMGALLIVVGMFLVVWGAERFTDGAVVTAMAAVVVVRGPF